ncbi:hypothetical protein EI555_007425 [Monodon monoceros]|uniref:Secreted protein n=1 Tax=Monodon monoceros TaxID=40151 RepID=A0A4U1EDP0_MONMO|nr:hypothetical protein EI555_007425 [Monodon monoceros]
MMPSMGLPSLSWMLPSCLLLLSQVQGETSLPLSLGSQCLLRAKKRRKAPVCLPCPVLPSVRISISSSVSPFFTKMACQKRPSGHLVSVLSGAEGSFISSLLKNNLKLLSGVWIGLHDPTEVHLHAL